MISGSLCELKITSLCSWDKDFLNKQLIVKIWKFYNNTNNWQSLMKKVHLSLWLRSAKISSFMHVLYMLSVVIFYWISYRHLIWNFKNYPWKQFQFSKCYMYMLNYFCHINVIGLNKQKKYTCNWNCPLMNHWKSFINIPLKIACLM